MGYREEIVDYLSKHKIGEILTTDKIKKEVHAIYGTELGSIVPSDYCYNITNKDPQSYIPDGNPRLLEQVKRGVYRYLGANYKYSGIVKHRKMLVGKWSEGKYHPYNSD